MHIKSKTMTLSLSCSKTLSIIAAFILFIQTIESQTIIQKDSEIINMVNNVSKDSLQSYIHQLVSFGTRSTLSTRTDKTKGIGAARNWVLNKFNLYAQQASGRMNAYIDTVTLPADNKRVNRQILLGNVVAVL